MLLRNGRCNSCCTINWLSFNKLISVTPASISSFALSGRSREANLVVVNSLRQATHFWSSKTNACDLEQHWLVPTVYGQSKLPRGYIRNFIIVMLTYWIICWEHSWSIAKLQGYDTKHTLTLIQTTKCEYLWGSGNSFGLQPNKLKVVRAIKENV